MTKGMALLGGIFLAALLLLAACDGGEEAQPTPTPSPAVVRPSPTVEPTGTATATPTATPDAELSRIFFARENELWSINADGSQPILLSTEVSAFYGDADVGGGVALQRDKVAFIATGGNLWVVDSTGENLTQVSAEAFFQDETYLGTSVKLSGWSPSGTNILYSVESFVGIGAEGKERPEVGLYLFDLDTGEKTRVPDLPKTDELNAPEVVPFIRWPLHLEGVIYQQQVGNEQTGDSYIEWHTMDLETGSTSKLTAVPFECAGLQPWVSPDGDTLIYSCGHFDTTVPPRDPGTSKIVIANVDNTDQRLLLEGIWAELQWPILSPSGERFIYQHRVSRPGAAYPNRPCIDDLQLFDLASGQQTLLASGCLARVRWVNDDSVLFLETENGLEDVTLYLVDVATGAKTRLADDVNFR